MKKESRDFKSFKAGILDCVQGEKCPVARANQGLFQALDLP
jgi:hypothetical protein